MYIVYINHVCLVNEYGSNDVEPVMITDNLEVAISKANSLVKRYGDDSAAHIDPEWNGSFDPQHDNPCIIFWDKEENWDWYSEVHIKEMICGKEYI